MSKTISVLVALFVALSSTTALAAAPEEVTTCGQVLRRDGYLSADLDCSADFVDAPTVVVGRGGTLDLRGFTLTSRPNAGLNPDPAVQCVRGCTVLGPGTVIGSEVSRSTVVGARADRTRIVINGATITGGDYGVRASRVLLRSAVVTATRSMGLWSDKSVVIDSEVSDHGTGVAPCVQRCIGIWATQVARIKKGSVLTGNGKHAVIAGRIGVSGSTFSSNANHPDCADHVCVDLATAKKPRLKDSTCEKSLNYLLGVNSDSLLAEFDPALHAWGICALD